MSYFIVLFSTKFEYTPAVEDGDNYCTVIQGSLAPLPLPNPFLALATFQGSNPMFDTPMLYVY